MTGGKRRPKSKSKPRTLRINKPFADAMFVKLNYMEPFGSIDRFNTGGNYYNWFFRGNSVYDPDPQLLSGAVAGFAEYAAMYQFYRVYALAWDIEVSNREAFPVEFHVTPVPLVPNSTQLTATPLSQWGMQTYSKHALMSEATGQDRTRIKGYMTTEKIMGNKSFLYDSTMHSPVTTNPTTIWSLAMGTMSNSVGTANGVIVGMKLTYYVKFYLRQFAL